MAKVPSPRPTEGTGSSRKKASKPGAPAKPGTRAKKSAAPKVDTAAAAHPTAKQRASGKDTARELATTIGTLALDKKALDVTVLDVRGLSSYADYFVVMTAESDPQVTAIADHIEVKLKENGQRPVSIEGRSTGQWVLIDYGDVVAHVFYQDMRSFYDLEGLWADAPRFSVKG